MFVETSFLFLVLNLKKPKTNIEIQKALLHVGWTDALSDKHKNRLFFCQNKRKLHKVSVQTQCESQLIKF
jgi:hypothetical protein